jgi:hypothetical protein
MPFIYVPDDNGTIQGAINHAVNGDTIIVRDGTYNLTAALDFKGKAITVTSENGADSCFLNGQALTRIVYFHSGEENSSVLSGFTIRNGKADKGGGIYCEGSSPTISHCKIIGNKAYAYTCFYAGSSGEVFSYGGGIYSIGSSPIIVDCTISGNCSQAIADGYNGHTQSRGGGIFCDGGAPAITNTIVSGNIAEASSLTTWYAQELAYGGGIYFKTSLPSIVNCTISNNQTSGDSESYGGGIASINSWTSVVNSIIRGNSGTNGGGVYLAGQSSSTLTNCTIVRNIATTHGGGFYLANSSPQIVNSILYQNVIDEIYKSDVASNPALTYSDVLGGYAGTGNINANPLFVNIGAGNFHLSSTSPCINAGDKMAPELPAIDLDGNPRVKGWNVDVGVYEYQSSPGSIAYGDFGVWGIWKWDGGWTQVAWEDASKILAYDNKLVANFSSGLWQYDGSNWTQLASASVQNIVEACGKVYGDFGPWGVWKWNGAWTQLSWGDPDKLWTYGCKLVANFPGIGLYQYNGSNWTALASSTSVESVVGVELP